jgi:hypothetical protein
VSEIWEIRLTWSAVVVICVVFWGLIAWAMVG